MVDIEPYQYQKTTNVKEHNDIVVKINEIVDVINNADIENIGPRIDAIESTDTLQWRDIESIKAKNTEQDSTLATHTTEIDGITKSIVSDVVLMNGTTVGNMKVRIERENSPFIDSNDYNIQKPTSVELVQGSAPAMIKAQITLSDGTVLISDDFMFTTEAIGQDVYISSFVFKNGNVAGTISADIGLSNGTTLEANNFVVPTDPNVLTSIANLTSRTEALEQIDIGGLKTAVDQHTVSIEALDKDVADLQIGKADVNNINQVIVTKQLDAESIIRVKGHNEGSTEFVKYGIVGGKPSNPFTVTQETDAFGQIVDKPIATIALLNTDGTPKNFTSGGLIEELDLSNLSNFPSDWEEGDIIGVCFSIMPSVYGASSWNSIPSLTENKITWDVNKTAIYWFILSSTNRNPALMLNSAPSDKAIIGYYVYSIPTITTLNEIHTYDGSQSEKILFQGNIFAFNGAGCALAPANIKASTFPQGIFKMWRLKN